MVVELPGHGADNTATYTLSIDAYQDKVIEAISAVKENVILVGHSMGGSDHFNGGIKYKSVELYSA